VVSDENGRQSVHYLQLITSIGESDSPDCVGHQLKHPKSISVMSPVGSGSGVLFSASMLLENKYDD
jgi:hypothetical protein